jgi:adenylate cyclase
MAMEIERKFVVIPEKLFPITETKKWKENVKKVPASFAYFKITGEKEFSQIRISHVPGVKCMLNVKGNLIGKCTRPEFECKIKEHVATDIIARSQHVVHRNRYKIMIYGLEWCVDELLERWEGIYLAEVEIPYPDYPMEIPSFIGDEITQEPNLYYNKLALTTSKRACDAIKKRYKEIVENSVDRGEDTYFIKKKKKHDEDDD